MTAMTQHFPMALFIMLYKVFVTSELGAILECQRGFIKILNSWARRLLHLGRIVNFDVFFY